MSEKLKKILEWEFSIILAIILALLFKYYVGSPAVVNQSSMSPTLEQDQKLWLNKWETTRNELPKRGDIITFEQPSKTKYTYEEMEKFDKIAKYENEPTGLFNRFTYYVLELNKNNYIKRVIALPGEYVEIKNEKVYINGEELEEGYLPEGTITNVTEEGLNNFIVPENCVFAMGDNREHSIDCRAFGCIPLEKIEGKVWIRIWPFNEFGKVK